MGIPCFLRSALDAFAATACFNEKGGWRVVDNIRGKQIHLLKLRSKHEDDFVSISAHNLVYQHQTNRVDNKKMKSLFAKIFYALIFLLLRTQSLRALTSSLLATQHRQRT